jgi:putative flavoprotein involved in K+ transport
MAPRKGNWLAGAVDVLVIGAGQSGLAMSRLLSSRAIDHVVLERGEVANSWAQERWDSLKLLTPNWLSRLPGYHYPGPDPDGYMSMSEVIDFIKGYAELSRAPVVTGTRVSSVRAGSFGFDVRTNRGRWRAKAVVIASGAFNVPVIPGIAPAIPASIRQLTPNRYRNPGDLADGGVMIVGASATGLQLAAEIQASGRQVTLCVGEHVRMPRVYRGKDIQYWMLATGLLDEGLDDIDDIERGRGLPSPQLIGSDDRRTLDLNALGKAGVHIVGRLAGIRDGRAQFSGGLRNTCKMADLKMNRLLDGIDAWLDQCGAGENAHPVERYAPTAVPEKPRMGMDLRRGEIESVIWATGFRPDHAYLDIPVFDRKGRIRHDGGVVDFPGLYLLGLPFLRRRKSSFIHGAEDDARDLSEHLASYLDGLAASDRARIAV